MNKIAIAAAAIGGFLLIGGGSAGVATAAGPIGIHSPADTSSLVIDVRRGGGFAVAGAAFAAAGAAFTVVVRGAAVVSAGVEAPGEAVV